MVQLLKQLRNRSNGCQFVCVERRKDLDPFGRSYSLVIGYVQTHAVKVSSDGQNLEMLHLELLEWVLTVFLFLNLFK